MGIAFGLDFCEAEKGKIPICEYESNVSGL
jgi:hypothetical protein